MTRRLRESASARWQEEERAGDETTRAVRAALEGLSREHAVVAGLRYAEGLSVEEIAMALDIPAGTVKSRLHYAREALRRALEQEQEQGKEKVDERS